MQKNAEIKTRLYQFIKYQNISVQAFEKKCGLSNGYVAAIRKGIGSEKLEAILTQFPQLNRTWLLFGEGEMLKQEHCSNCGSVLYSNSPVNLTLRESNALCVSEEVADCANSAKLIDIYEARLQKLQQEIAELHAKLLKLQDERIREQQEMLKHFSNLLANK